MACEWRRIAPHGAAKRCPDTPLSIAETPRKHKSRRHAHFTRLPLRRQVRQPGERLALDPPRRMCMIRSFLRTEGEGHILPQPGQTTIVNGWIVRNQGDGYGVRARRYDASPVTHIVIVEWTHPNYGYWADGGVFVKLAHAANWEALGTVCWFDFNAKDEFLAQYPDFAVLFDDRLELGEPVELPESLGEEANEYPHC